MSTCRHLQILPLLWLILSWLASPAVAATCYNSRGLRWTFTNDEPVEAWLPCDPTAKATNCCSPRDFCMSNGLCMDAVIDNMISQQGCTDQGWGEPCQNYCGGTQSDAAGLHFLWRCEGQSHCCGNNRSITCCEDLGVQTFVLEVGTQMFNPPTEASSSTASSSTASPSSMASSGNSATAANESTPPETSAPTSNNDNRNLSIGLGVGIPIGLALIGAVVFLAFQVRKRTNQANANPGPPIQQQWWPSPEAYKPAEHTEIAASSYSYPRNNTAELSGVAPRSELKGTEI